MQSKVSFIKSYGQKIWLDNLSRHMLNSNELKDLIAQDGICGVTSNPTIFHKAISQDSLYQEDLAKVKQSSLSLEERYESLVIPDIQAACDAFLPLYTQSSKNDGYVSFEVSPLLANDALKTIQSAISTWEKINRPNLMIKVPATKAGIEALEQLIFAGINVNITLIFSIKQIKNTWEAYIRGMTKRLNQALPIDGIRGVASFFLSRIDTNVDPKVPEELQGKAAIALAKKAYQLYLELFEGEVFKTLQQAGGVGQHLLFASTGTKNPKYSDVLYIEELIGENTINTVPAATLDAFRDHGSAMPRLTSDLNNVSPLIHEINKYIDLEELGEKLQLEGLKSFEESYDQLLNLVK